MLILEKVTPGRATSAYPSGDKIRKRLKGWVFAETACLHCGPEGQPRAPSRRAVVRAGPAHERDRAARSLQRPSPHARESQDAAYPLLGPGELGGALRDPGCGADAADPWC